ncbi:MAG: hypothetical protein FH753_06095 [Firmicutes bacterium]|nr:hypothetical protein [Bacillota bacterium]
MKSKEINKIIFSSFSLIMLLLLIGFIIKRQERFIYNLLASYIGYILFIYFGNKRNIKVKNYIKILVLLTIIIHTLIGQYFNFYLTTYWFDNLLHVFGAFSFALFFYNILNNSVKVNNNLKTFIFITIFNLGVTFGVIFEIIEFILDIFYKSTNQKSLYDTNLDLIFNFLGSALAGIYVLNKNRH